jgi:hypothetical protein
MPVINNGLLVMTETNVCRPEAEPLRKSNHNGGNISSKVRYERGGSLWLPKFARERFFHQPWYC